MLEVFVTKRRDRKAALNFVGRTMERYERPRSIVTDRLRSYRAAMNVIGNAADQSCGRWLNNRTENSHQPFSRRERAMSKFRDIKTLLSGSLEVSSHWTDTTRKRTSLIPDPIHWFCGQAAASLEVSVSNHSLEYSVT